MITISTLNTATAGAVVAATSVDPLVWVDQEGALVGIGAHGINFEQEVTPYQVGVAVDGVIASDLTGIFLRTNGGSIAIGEDGVVLGGEIWAGIYQFLGPTLETDIVNHGQIIGGYGIYVGNADDTIDNAGVIRATNFFAISTNGGNDEVTNSGKIIGDVILGNDNDKFIAKPGSTVDGTVNGGDGDDRYWIVNNKLTLADDSGIDKIISKVGHTLGADFEDLRLQGSKDLNGTGNASENVITGNTGDNKLKGLDGNDTLKGGKGADKLIGGNGRDTLEGGRGKDVYIGGAGNDDFVFSTNSGKDKIKDFDPNAGGEDIDLSGMASITGYSDLTNNHMAQVGENVVIDGNNGDVLTLIGIDIGDLSASDFLF